MVCYYQYKIGGESPHLTQGLVMVASFLTKADIYNHALSNLAISGITAPAQPEDQQTALTVLEVLMYEMRDSWNIRLGYNFEAVPNGGSVHNMPLAVFASIAALLALRLCKHYAIPATQALMMQANTADVVVSGWNSNQTLRQTQYPRRMARGSGSTLRWNRWQRFFRKPPQVSIQAGSETIYIVVNEINDYYEDFSSYLNAGETITSYEIAITNAITLLSDSIEGSRINYRIQADSINSNDAGYFNQIKITITTSNGRVNEALIDVSVTEFQVNIGGNNG